MNKFSLIKTINDVVNRRSNEYVNGNTISLPLEMRAEGDADASAVVPNGIMATEATMGKEVIPNQLWDVISDLKDKMVLTDLGVTFIHSNGTVELPRYSAEQASWTGEIADAKDVAGKFSSIKVAPLRLSAYCDISNTWLEMNGANAESVLRNEIINCLAEKLQKTILGNGKGSDVEPQGLLYGVKADTADVTYNDVVSMEETLESANVYGDVKYCVAPSAKSVFRTVKRDAGSGLFVWEKNQIEGIDAHSTNSVTNKGVILGDWSQLYVITFGNVRFTVDSLTKAISNQTRIVITMDCNYAVRRPEAFVKRILK